LQELGWLDLYTKKEKKKTDGVGQHNAAFFGQKKTETTASLREIHTKTSVPGDRKKSRAKESRPNRGERRMVVGKMGTCRLGQLNGRVEREKRV